MIIGPIKIGLTKPGADNQKTPVEAEAKAMRNRTPGRTPPGAKIPASKTVPANKIDPTSRDDPAGLIPGHARALHPAKTVLVIRPGSTPTQIGNRPGIRIRVSPVAGATRKAILINR